MRRRGFHVNYFSAYHYQHALLEGDPRALSTIAVAAELEKNSSTKRKYSKGITSKDVITFSVEMSAEKKVIMKTTLTTVIE